jgi:hypothetical protein
MNADIRSCRGKCGLPHYFCLSCYAEQPFGHGSEKCFYCYESQKRLLIDCRRGILKFASVFAGEQIKLRAVLADRSKPKFKMWSAENHRPNGKSGKANWEITFASNFSARHGGLVHVSRRCDRVRNEYGESIEHSDGRLIESRREPLSEHIGHGTAKRKGARGGEVRDDKREIRH